MPKIQSIVEKIGTEDSITFQGNDNTVLFEVKVFNSKGKLKKVINKKEISKQYWEKVEKETKNKRYKNSTQRGEIYYVST